MFSELGEAAGGILGGGGSASSTVTPINNDSTFNGASVTKGTSAVVVDFLRSLPAWAGVLSLVTFASVLIIGISKPKKHGRKKAQSRKRKATN
ncbi:MAG: hypothetical protein CML13_16005 [Puniceicoccaceae bacterium]|nr:hypothetical protein [Puniceicoccaceae bacterium]|tara:strand:+ start:10179 stop:10457 length:279 start_codon:yes stop_codon:yes gene_type:complete